MIDTVRSVLPSMRCSISFCLGRRTGYAVGRRLPIPDPSVAAEHLRYGLARDRLGAVYKLVARDAALGHILGHVADINTLGCERSEVGSYAWRLCLPPVAKSEAAGILALHQVVDRVAAQ